MKTDSARFRTSWNSAIKKKTKDCQNKLVKEAKANRKNNLWGK
ncbi:MAG: hypothetical protein VX737_04570 [Pseudomonadota bacterium]|nr:hypothetical protein [Pseudomonadota bacterium]